MGNDRGSFGDEEDFMLDDVVKGAVEGLVRGILSRKADESTGQIEAQSFVLRDNKGRGRAVLAMLEEGPGLTLLDGREEIKAVLALDKEGCFLAALSQGAVSSIVGQSRQMPRHAADGRRGWTVGSRVRRERGARSTTALAAMTRKPRLTFQHACVPITTTRSASLHPRSNRRGPC